MGDSMLKDITIDLSFFLVFFFWREVGWKERQSLYFTTNLDSGKKAAIQF